GNASTGVYISSGALVAGSSSGNVIGGTAPGAGNVISGNTQYGGQVTGGTTTGNTVQGNLIGTNLAGTAALGNGFGVSIDTGATNTTIGGTTAAARNLISGNGSTGLRIDSADGNTVSGNYIGVASDGSTAI